MHLTCVRFLPVFLLFLVVTVGCSGHNSHYNAGLKAQERHAYDEAVLNFSKALKLKPTNIEYKARYIAASSSAALTHLEKGRALRTEGKLVQAATELRQSYALNKTLPVALQELKEIESEQKIREILSEASEQYRKRRLPQAKNLVKKVLERDSENRVALDLLAQIREERNILVGGFELEVKSKEPITLKFKDASLKEVFKILNKLSGINFILDDELKSESVNLLLEDATFSQAMELLLKMNNLGSRVLNPKTMIVYSNSKEKLKQYEDQIIQTFYLSNIDAKKAVNMLRTMLQLRKVYVHEELNALVVRDRPDVINLVGQMLENADLSDSEVVFDLELIEVNHTDTLQIGPKLSAYSVNAGAFKGGDLVSGTLLGSNLVSDLSGLDVLFTLPTATFDLSKTLADTDILATPKIRVKNREKAKVHVGTREPSITSTSNGTTVSESVQYIDVGIKVDVEPVIQLDGSVKTKLRLEVSSASEPTTTDNGTRVFTINTTNAETSLILKDGERTIIGGLIRKLDSKGRKSIPILGDIPFIGALFNNYDMNDSKREILLSITPHIVKNISLPGVDATRIWSGGEEELKAGPNFAAFAEEAEPAERKSAPQLKPKVPKPVVPSTVLPPSAVDPAAVEPVAVEPAAVEPVAVEPAAVEPVAVEPVAVEPVAVEPAAVEPAAVEPAAVEPAAVEPAAVEPAAVEPAAVEPAAVPVELMSDASIEGPPAVPRVFFSGTQLVKVDEEFFVELQVGEVKSLSSAPLFVNYDQHLLRYLRTEEGDFLKQSGQSTIFTSSPNPDRGELILGSKQSVGGAGADGSGTLARIYFKATASGTAVVRPNRVNFRSSTGKRLKTKVTPFQIEIQ